MQGPQAATFEPLPEAAQAPAGPCHRCGLELLRCVCDHTPRLQTRLDVLILQHPAEQDEPLASAALAARCLPRARRVVGLSWASLAAAWPDPGPASRWAVLVSPSRQAAEAPGGWLIRRRGKRAPLRGLIVLDGTWSQAKSLWWRNPWLLRCSRLSLSPTQPSAYGKLRRQPHRLCLSTLEAIAEALTVAGEPEQTQQQMRQLFRRFVQRARDLPPPPA